MPLPRLESNYEPDFLRRFFYIGQDDNGDWRVYHAIDRAVKGGHRSYIGDFADGYITKGYRTVFLPFNVGDGGVRKRRQVRLQAHCVIYSLHHNKNPGQRLVDHIDRNPMNNDPVNNLRLAEVRLNNINRKPSNTGYLGSCYQPNSRSYKKYLGQAYNPALRKKAHLGNFHTAEEAARAYDAFIEQNYPAGSDTNVTLGLLPPLEPTPL